MIFICTSMYCEASPFIKQLNLKKDSKVNKFEIFKNDEIILIITGVGKIKAAVAVSYLLSKYEPGTSDLFINIGVCGANKDMVIGNAYLCNKIIENDTKKTFYPDILFKHPYKEASVETCSNIIKSYDNRLEGQLVDMEASGIYQAALLFFETHQVFFIKIVSDYLNTKNLSEAFVLKLVEDKVQGIIAWMNEIKLGFLYNKNVLSNEEQEILNLVVENLKLSSTMENQLKQLIIYYKLQHGDINDILNIYKTIECKSKSEGKRYFDKLKQELV